MAELVTALRKALGVACLGACLLAAASVSAQALPDPTRPPDSPNQAGASGTPATPVLQSVKISPGRRSAVISGKEVMLNGKFGDARVVSITETEVVLRSGKRIRKLKLFPDIDVQKSKARRQKDNG